MVLRSVLTPLVVLLVLITAGPLSGARGDALRRHRLADGRPRLVTSKRGAIVSGRNLAPGSRVAGSVTITNAGSAAGVFALSGTVRGSRRLAGYLELTVRELRRTTSRVVYSGSLARFHAVKLGVIRPGRAQRFRFSVRFQSNAPNSLQRQRTTANFAWRAVQFP
jgi:hypothetical protein